MKMPRRTTSPGFTIVELLVVIVVIAILAAIAIVSYNGITTKARESLLKSDLRNGATQLQIAKLETGSYPNNDDELKRSTQTDFTYTSSGTTFCLAATSNQFAGKSFFITESSGIEEGECGGSTMQAFTPSQCSALTAYTGSNEEAVITLTDPRGTPQTYQVAKLADDNCWMIDNLKLGSTTSTITLTPSDSNVASNFTLPQLTTSGATDYDNPGAYGSVPGDTGSGTTNYGYLYNWSAATAGESRATKPAGSGNASHDICPANWRLPTGGNTGEFAWLNAKMNNPSASAPSTSGGSGFYQNWHNIGPFKGVFSGSWYGSFYDQGSNGYFWSSSAHASNANHAHSANFIATYVYSNNSDVRNIGFGVRCLLN